MVTGVELKALIAHRVATLDLMGLSGLLLYGTSIGTSMVLIPLSVLSISTGPKLEG